MNPLLIFDYVYYSIAYLYANVFEYKKEKAFAGIMFLSIFQNLNVITIVGLISILTSEQSVTIHTGHYIVGFACIAGFNTIRYKKLVPYEGLYARWKNDSPKNKLIKVALVVIYMILSIVSFVHSGTN